jgi:hypothetical protein
LDDLPPEFAEHDGPLRLRAIDPTMGETGT